MKKYVILFISLFIAFASSAQEAKWHDLFNGKNLKGWTRVNGTADFIVKDKTIIGTSKVSKVNTFLATDKMYDDFILEFDFITGIEKKVEKKYAPSLHSLADIPPSFKPY